MGLHQNGSYLNAEPIKQSTGGAGAVCETRAAWNSLERAYNFMASFAGIDSASGVPNASGLLKSGYPEGYAPPYQFVMPIKDGGMSSFVHILGVGTASTDPGMLSVTSASGIIPASGALDEQHITLMIYPSGAASGVATVSADMRGQSNFRSTIDASGFVDPTSSMSMLLRLYAEPSGIGYVDTASYLSGLSSLSGDIPASGAFDGSLSVKIYLASDVPASGSFTATLTGLNGMSASLSGVGDIPNSALSLITFLSSGISASGALDGSSSLVSSFSGSLSGSGEINYGALTMLIRIASSLSATGSLAGEMKGLSSLSASTSGGGSISSATLKGLSWLISSITGAGSVVLTLRGDSFLAANISATGDVLTAQGCANAVWAALMETGMTAQQALRLLTAIAAGKTTIGTGDPVVVTFRDINDTVTRVTAEMEESERKVVTKNLD